MLSRLANLTPRRVFVLTGGQLSVFHWRGGTVSEPLVFVSDENGLRGFAQYLSHSDLDPSYLLVDLVEEEFRQDTIPHVFGADRRALLATRRNRLFRDARYTAAIQQGRQSGGRRDDLVLFTALIRPELLSPWLSQMAKMKVPLVGIYSVPVVSRSLLRKLPTESRDVLLVTLQASGGLRQTFFSEGQLKVSRLAVAPRLDPNQHASYVLTEVEKLRRYLASLRLIEPGAAMDVVLLTGRSLLQDLKRQVADTIEVRFHALDLNEFAPTVGLKSRIDSPYADAMFAHLLARENPPNFYARTEDTRYITHHRMRAGLSAASVAILLGAISFSGFQFVNSVQTKREATSLAQRASFYEERYQRGKAELPKVPAEPFELKQAVELVEALRNRKVDPFPVMVVVSRGLRTFGRIQIERIDWAASVDPQAPIGAKGGVAPRPNSFGRPAPVAADPNAYFHLARVHGRIEPFDGDYREALDLVNRFAAALGGVGEVHEVRLTKLPFDASSRRRLAGSAVRETQREEAEFELRLVVRSDGETGAAS